jgi:hypothetical protein
MPVWKQSGCHPSLRFQAQYLLVARIVYDHTEKKAIHHFIGTFQNLEEGVTKANQEPSYLPLKIVPHRNVQDYFQVLGPKHIGKSTYIINSFHNRYALPESATKKSASLWTAQQSPHPIESP